MTKTWHLFEVTTEKEASYKVIGEMCKVQALNLSHHRRTDDIMQQLEEKGNAFMQMVVDK